MPEEIKKIVLQCDCNGGHFMQWLKFENEENELYVSFYGTEIFPFWRRLKMAWHLLRRGEYENDGILLNNELDKLKKYLEEIT